MFHDRNDAGNRKNAVGFIGSGGNTRAVTVVRRARAHAGLNTINQKIAITAMKAGQPSAYHQRIVRR